MISLFVILAYFTASTVLGYLIVLLFLRKSWQICTHIFSGWIIGQILCSFLLFLFTFISSITIEILVSLILVEMGISFFIFLYLWNNFDHSLFEISFEESFSYYFSILTIAVISYVYLSNIYSNVPYSVPFISIPTFDEELSFISSVLYGINSKKADISILNNTSKFNLFNASKCYFNKIFDQILFNDPFNMKEKYKQPTIPLLYVVGCCALGLPINDALFIIHFLNILATTAFLFYFATLQGGKRFLFIICMMLNGGWAFFRFFFIYDSSCDFIFNNGYRTHLPIYHFLTHHLSFSLSSSYSIPLAILSLCYSENELSDVNSYLFGGFLASLIPNFLTSISVFAISFCHPNCVKIIFPFLVSLIPKILKENLIVQPVWREFQNEGYYFSHLLIWFESFGPVFLATIHLLFNYKDKSFYHLFLSRLSLFLLLNIIRDGNDIYETSIAINSVFLPFIILYSLESLFNIKYYFSKNGSLKGFVNAIVGIVIFTYIAGGGINIIKTRENTIEVLNEYDLRLSEYINDNINTNETFYVLNPKSMNPITILLGRQLFMGNTTFVWKRGGDIQFALSDFLEIDQSGNISSILKKYNFHYLLIHNEIKEDAFNLSLTCFRTLFSNEKWNLYTT
ncbi:hypothetical protein TRFO_09765 [Tritrichomonas foetus]|uniref:Mannosyltransferase n=1 Tax=Tritrichomonas foetus TaxID=1144522 RepID=A0A1J4JI25_9EUKA|nr:hypothetical protein TRFO_09765 [Tritrichomonas foetus]|eukprot:OHS96860.1 hypothetical protein TRFO_09765 [Tritrichomonas foetus]